MSSFHRVFNQWLKAYTGQTVIAAYQSRERPEKPYLMTNVTDVLPLYQQSRECTADTEADPATVTTIHDMEYRVSIHAYGDDPAALLAPVTVAKHLPTAQALLAPYCLHELGRIEFVPEQINAEWEPRAVLRLTCHGIHRETREADVIESVETINIEETA